jgi:dipeptidase E
MGKIVCIGGLNGLKDENGKFTTYIPRKIDREIINLANKKHPKVLFIGTASKEREDYFESFKIAYESLGSKVESLSILDNKLTNMEILDKILSVDIIYVGCGNTRFMLDKWKQYDIDTALRKAYEKGTVLAGMSAGSYCWFAYNYDLIQGLGLINAINCVHYNKKDIIAKEKFYDVIRNKKMPGFALDDCVSFVYIDGDFKIIKNYEEGSAYKIFYDGNKFIEEEMKE